MAVSKSVAPEDYFFFLRPFSRNVWVSIVLGIFFFFGLIFIFDRFSPYGWSNNIIIIIWFGRHFSWRYFVQPLLSESMTYRSFYCDIMNY